MFFLCVCVIFTNHLCCSLIAADMSMRLPSPLMLTAGAPTWTELRVSARQALQALGELPDTDRPLLTYGPAQLAALLQRQGIDVSTVLPPGLALGQLGPRVAAQPPCAVRKAGKLKALQARPWSRWRWCWW